MTFRGWKIAGFAGLVLAGAGVGVAIGQANHLGRHTPRKPLDLAQLAQPIGPTPFAGAKKESSFQAAESDLGWHMPRPHGCAADDGSANVIYVSTSSGQADVRYADVSPGSCTTGPGGQIELIVSKAETPLGGSARIAEMNREATAEGPIATVQTVAGVPAVVLQGGYPGDDCASLAPGEQGCVPQQQNPTAIRTQIGGIDVQLLAPGSWTETELIKLANTMN